MRGIVINSLRTRLILLIATAVIPALAFILYMSYDQRKQREAEIYHDALSTARLAAHNLEQIFSGSRQILTAFAAMPAVQAHNATACNSYAVTFHKSFPRYANISAAKSDGAVFCSPIPFAKKVNVAERTYFQEAIGKKIFFVDSYLISKMHSKQVLPVAMPALDQNGQVKAVVFAGIELAWLIGEMKRVSIHPEYDAVLTVLDRNLTIIYRNKDSQASVGRNVGDTPLEKIIGKKREGNATARGFDGVDRIWAFVSVAGLNDSIFVRYGISSAAAFSEINRLLVSNLVALMAITFLSILVAWFGSDIFVLRRMKLLQKATDELKSGNLKARVNVGGGSDEISRLGANVNEMAEALEHKNQMVRISERKYTRLFEESKDMVSVATPEGRYLDMNPAGVELFGYSSREEILQIDIARDLYADPGEREAYVREMNEKGFVKDYPLRLKTKDGRILNILATGIAVRDKRGEIIEYHAINRDMTEYKRLEEERVKLESQNWQLQKAESLGRMAGAIAHTFNNQLQTVMMCLEMAMNDSGRNERQAEKLTTAMQASRKAAEVSALMLTYTGHTHDKEELLDISEVCRQYLPMIQAGILESVIFETELPAAGPIIRASTNQIQHILINLVTNACESLKNGRGSVRLRVREVPVAEIPREDRFPVASQTQHKDYVLIEVSDTGCGIEIRDVERLFDPFYSTKFAGRGMGLAVVLGIVRAHGGIIAVESTPGTGSTFCVYLPIFKEVAI